MRTNKNFLSLIVLLTEAPKPPLKSRHLANFFSISRHYAKKDFISRSRQLFFQKKKTLLKNI